MSILVIEDQKTLAVNIQKYLESEDYAVSVSFDGKDGLDKAMSGEFDLIVLDLNLPGVDGLTICSALREKKINSHIIILTARSGRQSIIEGLNCGADDYLTKPFDLEELLARIRAALRRTGDLKDPVIKIGDILIDTNTHQVWRNGKAVALAPKEFALLAFLARHKGRAMDRTEIIENVWGEYDTLMFSQTVDVHVAYLRRKLGKKCIVTVSGKGYLINDRD